MPGSERHSSTTPLKNDIERHLRSASPAIKRPASEMGAADREVHTQDVDMDGTSENSAGSGVDASQGDSAIKAKQQDTGSRHLRSKSNLSPPQESDPKAFRQVGTSDSDSPTSDSLLQAASFASTAPASLTMNSTTSATNSTPSIDEQVAIVTEMVERPAQDKQRGFVTSTRWLNRVLARSSQKPEGLKGEKLAAEGEIGPVDNSELVMITEDSGKFKDEQGEMFVPLRPGLTKGEELRILPQDAWDLVMQWYGSGDSPVITRYAHNTSAGDDTTCEYELYPPIFSLLKVPATSTVQTQKERDIRPVRTLASRETLFQDWLKNAKQLLNIEMNTKVRIWKILGGLKSSSASGMLTPAASRSASPAPGVEIVASAGDHMLLDVNTFNALHIGDQREQLDAKDETANEKYNGRSLTLGIAGLARDEVIVLEEQSADGSWPSESSGLLSIRKGGLGKSKGVTGSGRSSPAPSMMTRGRQQKNGRPRGITGLTNLGNTCYMNSALQCLRSVEELTQYFLLGQHKNELNPTNVLGYHGKVALAYGELLKGIYEDGPSSFSPNKFKQVIGRHGPSFSGYQQQDSQEFLLFLLDGLQEDLNRIIKKPYNEKPDSTDAMVHDPEALKAFAELNWQQYKARNDSIITDLFAGMYKSTVTCPVCDKVSIIFDPFSNLTLQLPIENTWAKEIIYFPLYQRPIKIDVDIDKHANILALKDYVAQRVHVDVKKLVVAEAYRNKFYKMFDNSTVISEASIQGGDVICVYELDSIPTNYNPDKQKKYNSSLYTTNRDDADELVDIDSPKADRLLVPVYHRQPKGTNNNRPTRPFFGEPSYVVIDRDDAKSFDRILKKILGVVSGMTTLDILSEETNIVHVSNTSPEDSDTMVMTDDGNSSDSNNLQAMSVQGEDGLVDISMRESTQPEPHDATSGLRSSVPHVLQSSPYIPAQLKGLLDLKVVSTKDGIPTGWNEIHDNQDYEPILSRQRKQLTHRPARPPGGLTVVNGSDNENESGTESDLGDIHHDEDEAHSADDDSESDSNGASLPPSGGESDGDLPDAATIIGGRGGRRKNKKKQTYSRKGKHTQPQQTRPSRITPQPSPQVPSEALIRPGDAILVDWNGPAFDTLFSGTEGADDGMRGSPTWADIELFHDEELAKKRAQRQARRKNGISLEDCLNEFGKSETLSENNAWRCPRCKELRRAKKQFELWKVPDILVMHLKRFSSNRNFRDKLEVFVDYPVEGLDITERVLGEQSGSRQIYDLIAVDNHYGGLGGGHYTAYGKNFFNNSWYEYNDAHVSSKTNAQNVVTGAAYLLFYRRRSDHPLGGPKMMELLEQHEDGDSEMQGGSRETSPVAGEGRRLGDSSHNGSSSAFNGAGQVHLVGDGGSATRMSLVQSPGAVRGHGSLLKSIETSDDVLPGYKEMPGIGERSMGISSMNNMSYSGAGLSSSGSVLNWADNDNPWGVPDIRMAGPSMMITGPPGSATSENGREDAEMGGDGSSTKVEGSPLGSNSPGSERFNDRMDDFSDTENFMDTTESVSAVHNVHFVPGMRGVRESAPPPGDEDDDDLPVAEILVPDDAGDD